MVITDAEARKAVRALIERFDLINEQHLGLAYVLARQDAQRYSRLLESAERATALVIRPLKERDDDSREVYTALDNPQADWTKAIFAMLGRGAVVLEGNQGNERLKLLQELDARFDAEDCKGKQ